YLENKFKQMNLKIDQSIYNYMVSLQEEYSNIFSFIVYIDQRGIYPYVQEIKEALLNSSGESIVNMKAILYKFFITFLLTLNKLAILNGDYIFPEKPGISQR